MPEPESVAELVLEVGGTEAMGARGVVRRSFEAME